MMKFNVVFCLECDVWIVDTNRTNLILTTTKQVQDDGCLRTFLDEIKTSSKCDFKIYECVYMVLLSNLCVLAYNLNVLDI
jgi:hypothetical protein